jgi:hypothetical protein
MHDTNRNGLDRHSDDIGSKLAAGRPAAICGLVGSTLTLLTSIRRAL